VGYASGPDATVTATAAALARADHAQSVVLVEGVSDQIALETLAKRCGRDLTDEGVVVVPIGGAQAISKFLRRFGDVAVRLSGLCDAAAAGHFEDALVRTGLVLAGQGADLERQGFFVCVEDLEDELIRAVGRSAIEAVLSGEGELGSFHTLQTQPPWRGAPFDAQVRRFLGSGSRRKLRYAHLLVLALELDRVPKPLEGVLARA